MNPTTFAKRSKYVANTSRTTTSSKIAVVSAATVYQINIGQASKFTPTTIIVDITVAIGLELVFEGSVIKSL
jgi:hypothetical protein